LSVGDGGDKKSYGEVLGKTVSGKEVFENKKGIDYKDFSEKDHEDATHIHAIKSGQYERQYQFGGVKEAKEKRRHHMILSVEHNKLAKKKYTED